MKTLRELLAHQSPTGMKLRFADWNHRIRFFTVSKIDESGNVTGQLDSGETISFDIESDFWFPYNEGDEDQARAI